MHIITMYEARESRDISTDAIEYQQARVNLFLFGEGDMG